MSNRYKGAIISATPPTTTGGPTGTASGAWTLEQQMQLQAASLWPSQPPPPFIEDVFSCFLYTGNGSTQTITNNIDLSTKGGLTWIKGRSGATGHRLTDTARGVTKSLASDSTNAEATETTGLTAFGTTGFTIGADADYNTSAATYVSWTFREQPKFFDIVTYTGNGTASRAISHNLGSAPATMIVKQTDGTRNWPVYHRSVPTGTGYLNLTSAFATGSGNGVWGDSAYNNIAPTSTVFYVGSDSEVNGSGLTYVAYLFAHDAGGFGLTETDNVISCGSFTTDGSGNATVSLGYEPQWLMVKASTYAQSWYIEDNMRAFNLTSRAILFPNLPNAEATGATAYLAPNSTGFAAVNGQLNASTTYIYIAIRRGPMKVPTLGTSVFEPAAYTGNGTDPRTVGTLQVTDLAINMNRSGAGDVPLWIDRLRGPEVYLRSSGTGAESSGLTGWLLGQSGQTINGVRNTSPTTYIDWLLRRAPSFMDVVCYTGTGSARTVTHNLAAVPELILVKSRSNVDLWAVYSSGVDATSPQNYGLFLNTTDAKDLDVFWNNTVPTSTQFSVSTKDATNRSGGTFVAYLFATCADVSKVGSYTGNAGYTVTVPCGFTAGVRFVLIKRTDSTGDWYVWDSARGIVAGNDPYLLLNSTAAEVTGTDYVDTYAAGFEVTSTAPAGLNATGGTYIFLAIA